MPPTNWAGARTARGLTRLAHLIGQTYCCSGSTGPSSSRGSLTTRFPTILRSPLFDAKLTDIAFGQVRLCRNAHRLIEASRFSSVDGRPR